MDSHTNSNRCENYLDNQVIYYKNCGVDDEDPKEGQCEEFRFQTRSLSPQRNFSDSSQTTGCSASKSACVSSSYSNTLQKAIGGV